MRGFVYILSLFMLVALVAGCSKEKNDCLKSTGDIMREDRTVQTFKEIEVYNNVNVVITQGIFSAVTVEAGENLIDKVTTELRGDVLVIKNENKCNWVRSYKHEITAYVTTKTLERISHNGYGKISGTNTIQSDGLVISINGNGDVELDINANYCFSDMHKTGDLILSGYAGTSGLWSSGNNWIRCEDLITDTTFVESRTTGDCFVNVSSKFQALLNGSGNIYYSGDPGDVKTEVIGSGVVYKN